METVGDTTVKPSHAEAFASLLEPGNGDPGYISMRRLLLYRKALDNKLVRQKWELNGQGYVAFHEYMRHLKTLQGSQTSQPASPTSTQGALDSGPWAAYERGSWSSSRGGAVSESGAQEILSEPGYSFVGMHCVFDECKASVNIVKFGHMSSDLLAFGASNGLITVCSVVHPPQILHRMSGHTKEVTDIDWSSNNQYLSSSSLDKSVRVWDVKKGECLRVIYGTAPQLCIRFHPVNNNILLVGNGNKEIAVFNFSTGRIIHKLALDSNVTSLDVDHSGQILFAGDARGTVHSVTIKMHHGNFVMRSAHRSSLKGLHKSATTTIQFRTYSRLAAGPVLLAATQDGLLRFFTVALQVEGYLSLKCSLQLPPRARNIRASFCPLLSLQKGEFIVSGHEDSNVYFYDFTRPRHPCVNKLQGHAVPVVGVAWNHGENLLASSDCEGLVIVWKRAKTAAR
jgi:WD40 repeat protein